VAWYLNGALTRFRVAVNAAYPRRDTTSDGTIGDTAHQGTNSDHNPDPDGSVDAWDMDVNLRSGDDVTAIEDMKRVFQAHPSSRYWIHNRQIASRSTGWRRERYNGDNPHTQHCHWNTRESHEDSTVPWLIGEFMATLTEAEKNELFTILRGLRPLGEAIPGTADVGGPPRQAETLLSDMWAGEQRDTSGIAPGVKTIRQAQLGRIETSIAGLTVAVAVLATALAGKDEETAALLQPHLDAIRGGISGVGEAVAGVDEPEDIADMLRGLLGDKAVPVGQLLAQA
jgi:hypothetical protein